jgi:hypothetical protein
MRGSQNAAFEAVHIGPIETQVSGRAWAHSRARPLPLIAALDARMASGLLRMASHAACG